MLAINTNGRLLFKLGVLLTFAGLLSSLSATVRAQTQLQTGFGLTFSNYNNVNSNAQLTAKMNADASFHVMGMGGYNYLEVDIHNTSTFTIDEVDFNALSGTPGQDLVLDTKIQDLQGNDAGVVKKVVDDPNHAGVSLDWGFTFNGPTFLPGPGDATFLVKILSPQDPLPLISYQNSTGDYGLAHFTRITGFGNVSSAWGGIDQTSNYHPDFQPSVTPDGSSLYLLCGGMLPVLVLGYKRLRRN